MKKKGKGKKAVEVTIKVVGTDGKPSTKQMKMGKTAMSLGEMLKSAGISGENKDLLVNSKPATLETSLDPKGAVKGKITVQVAERPQGS
ncbi:MAG: hypothetical protein A2754_02525 [Candidatus Magasanikbacteria bacterium RIFCSPHIGHO2_01_FULL_47_8]|uniref:Ubiquitin-like domain-containing protein n=1 Tax=Candidatus Magasanikbacteria bacterium RIFCSPHIGHO2_01_FULL_47_8 TaxID=1798673 RepID=A0A1F6MC98_9BACT|nr:MAG: hypothetical protein A2754_02525 [Candidatus Magasanikbacteria bacterium RIFCSPHIGHO2_01_FULL_47_8]